MYALKTFCGFSMGRNQYWAGRVYDLCVYYMTGTPEGSTEIGFSIVRSIVFFSLLKDRLANHLEHCPELKIHYRLVLG